MSAPNTKVMGMKLTKEFVNSCRKVGVLRDFLCQAIDQVDEKDKEIAELKEQYKDMDVTHTVHIAKMNAKIDQLEDDVALLRLNNAELREATRWLNVSEGIPAVGASVHARSVPGKCRKRNGR